MSSVIVNNEKTEILLVIRDNGAFVFNGVQYPDNWIANATQEQKDSINLLPLEEFAPEFSSDTHNTLYQTFDIYPDRVEAHWVQSAKTSDAIIADLENYKQIVKKTIDQQAEDTRLKYLTPGSGQAMVYNEKNIQAQVFLNDQSPTAEKYPMIYGEVGITANTATEVAQIVLGMYQQWKVLGATIETIRLTAKKQIDDATTLQQCRDILASITWV